MGSGWLRAAVLRATATPATLGFTFLLLAQTAHLLEHVAQMIEIHLLGVAAADARGIVGQLDVEWVHFIWNLGVFLALVALVAMLGPNRILVLVTLFAGWHLLEHDVIMQAFLARGLAGAPGLLAHGGIIGGGLPISRPDLHFVYNLIETAGIFAAWSYQLRRTTSPIARRSTV